jgi:hypothetical protein
MLNRDTQLFMNFHKRFIFFALMVVWGHAVLSESHERNSFYLPHMEFGKVFFTQVKVFKPFYVKSIFIERFFPSVVSSYQWVLQKLEL